MSEAAKRIGQRLLKHGPWMKCRHTKAVREFVAACTKKGILCYYNTQHRELRFFGRLALGE